MTKIILEFEKKLTWKQIKQINLLLQEKIKHLSIGPYGMKAKGVKK